jgi:hypothetical protein
MVQDRARGAKLAMLREETHPPAKPLSIHDTDEYVLRCRFINCRLARMECMIGMIVKAVDELKGGRQAR